MIPAAVGTTEKRRNAITNFARLIRWTLPVATPVFVLAFLSPVQAILRFATPDQFSGDGRIGIWRDTVRLIRAYPWIGCGLGAFERALSPFRTFAPNNTVDYAHNDYLQIVAELGWPGALLVGESGGLDFVVGGYGWSMRNGEARVTGKRPWEFWERSSP